MQLLGLGRTRQGTCISCFCYCINFLCNIFCLEGYVLWLWLVPYLHTVTVAVFTSCKTEHLGTICSNMRVESTFRTFSLFETTEMVTAKASFSVVEALDCIRGINWTSWIIVVAIVIWPQRGPGCGDTNCFVFCHCSCYSGQDSGQRSLILPTCMSSPCSWKCMPMLLKLFPYK